MNVELIMQFLNRLSDYLFIKSFERSQSEPTLFKDEMATEDKKAATA